MEDNNVYPAHANLRATCLIELSSGSSMLESKSPHLSANYGIFDRLALSATSIKYLVSSFYAASYPKIVLVIFPLNVSESSLLTNISSISITLVYSLTSIYKVIS